MLSIGICGASGSGKTTLALELMDRIDGRALLINQDAYYLDHPHLPFALREKLNYDEPGIFDHELIYQDIRALTEGRPILKRGYDYAQHRRCDPLTPVEPADVLIFEGIHAFYDPRVRALLDFKLFVKVDPDICLLRRVQRDILERGRHIDGIAEQYLATVKPMYEKYVRNYVEHADVIVAKGGRAQKIADVLAFYINYGMRGKCAPAAPMHKPLGASDA